MRSPPSLAGTTLRFLPAESELVCLFLDAAGQGRECVRGRERAAKRNRRRAWIDCSLARRRRRRRRNQSSFDCFLFALRVPSCSSQKAPTTSLSSTSLSMRARRAIGSFSGMPKRPRFGCEKRLLSLGFFSLFFRSSPASLAPLSCFLLLSLLASQATTTTTSNDPRSASPDVAQRTAGLKKRRGSSDEQQQQEQQQPPQLERNSGGSPRTVFGAFFFFSVASEGIEPMGIVSLCSLLSSFFIPSVLFQERWKCRRCSIKKGCLI